MAKSEDDPAMTALTSSALSGIADAVEHAVREVYAVGLKSSHVEPLMNLLRLDWHTRHEDIVGLLQRSKDDRAIDLLFDTATAQFDYLDYDEFEGLARSCIWALADIGSPRALAHINALANSDNVLIADYAKKRLSQ